MESPVQVMRDLTGWDVSLLNKAQSLRDENELTFKGKNPKGKQEKELKHFIRAFLITADTEILHPGDLYGVQNCSFKATASDFCNYSLASNQRWVEKEVGFTSTQPVSSKIRLCIKLRFKWFNYVRHLLQGVRDGCRGDRVLYWANQHKQAAATQTPAVSSTSNHTCVMPITTTSSF